MPLHEVRQHLKGLRFERDRLPGTAQLIALDIQLTIAKQKAHAAVSFRDVSAARMTRLQRHLHGLEGDFLALHTSRYVLLLRTKCSITKNYKTVIERLYHQSRQGVIFCCV